MGHGAKWEYFRATYERYRRASRREKGVILDEFCRNSGYQRKYAIRRLNGPPSGQRRAPAVVARKVWGGSRTERGAQTQQILVSLLATCRQRNHPAQAALIGLLCSPNPRSLDFSVADLPPPRPRAAPASSQI